MVFAPVKNQGVAIGIHRMCAFQSHLLRRGDCLQGVVMIMVNGIYGWFGRILLMDMKNFQQTGRGYQLSIEYITELKSLVFGMSAHEFIKNGKKRHDKREFNQR
jgi:hypothetical protein